jgi:hypothetical protein
MLKASKALKGGVTIGLSALTFLAYGGTALAATSPQSTNISITPPATGTTGNTGDCLIYTASITSPAGPFSGNLDIDVTHPAGTIGSVTFCSGGATTNTNSTTEREGQQNVSSAGSITFGIRDTVAETDTITVFDDRFTNNTLTGGDANAESSAIFVGNNGDAAVKNLAISSPVGGVNAGRQGDTAAYEVVATNGNTSVPLSEQGVDNAAIWYEITAGPDAGTDHFCGFTNGSGDQGCNVAVTSATAGADTVVFYVNNAPLSGPNPDTGDTQAKGTLTNYGLSPAGDTLIGSCPSSDPSTNSGRDCTRALDLTNTNEDHTQNRTFEFDVLDPATNTSDPGVINNDFGHNVAVDFTMSGGSTNAHLTTGTQTCHTGSFIEDGKGACDTETTVVEPNPTINEKITVTGTIHLGTTTQTDTATETFVASTATARTITLTPATSSVVAGHTGVLTATVKDAAGNPVQNERVQFSTTGQGAFTTGCVLSASCVTETSGGIGPFGGLPNTDSHGQIQIQVSSGTTGTENISALLSSTSTECGDAAGFVNGVPVSGVPAGNCSTTATVSYTTAPKPPHISETPHLKGHKHGHTVHLTAVTHPTLRHQSVHFYRLHNGILHLVAVHTSGSTGTAHVTLHGVHKGHHTYVARVVGAGANVTSHRSNHKHIHIT